MRIYLSETKLFGKWTKAYIFNYHKIHNFNLLALQTSFKHG